MCARAAGAKGKKGKGEKSRAAAEEDEPEHAHPASSTTLYDPTVFQRPHPDDRGGANKAGKGAAEEAEVIDKAKNAGVSAGEGMGVGMGIKGKGKGKGKGKKEEEAAVEMCAHCGTEESEANPLKKCSRCKLVWYCAEGGCQCAAWVGGHRERCQTQEAQAAVDPVEELLCEHAPGNLKCPISKELMNDPVTLVGDGMTYERASIERWLAAGNTTSPVTNAELSSLTCAPSQLAKNMIRAWREGEGAELVRKANLSA